MAGNYYLGRQIRQTFRTTVLVNIKSPGLQTDLIYPQYSGLIIDRDEYLVVKTPARPNYFWGNYLVMPEAPKQGDLDKWRSLYNLEFDSGLQGFMTFAIDADIDHSPGITEFTAAGFSAKSNVVLTAKQVSPPPKINPDIVVREIDSAADWEQIPEVHYSNDWYLNPESQKPFLEQKMNDLRKLSSAGVGCRFGAFLGNKLVADLGVYRWSALGRFNDVATHREFRRLGICGTLVFQAARIALDEMEITTLVMEADEDYHAAKIYESIGFNPTYRQAGLEWFDPAIHG